MQETLYVDGPGENTGWEYQYPTSGQHYQKVQTNDGDLSYVYYGNSGKRDCYSMTDPVVLQPGDTINSVSCYYNAKGADNAISPYLKINGVNYDSNVWLSFPGMTYQNLIYTFYNKGGVPFTYDDIIAIQQGMISRRDSPAWRSVSYCKMIVDFTQVDLATFEQGQTMISTLTGINNKKMPTCYINGFLLISLAVLFFVIVKCLRD